MNPKEREGLLVRYENGVKVLKEAFAEVPPEALQWRPAPDKWSVHEVIVHCADSETNSAMRIRYLVGESSPVIAGYDQDRWAKTFDYHRMPMDLSMRQLEAVRAWTAAFIRSLPDAAWSRSGRHTEITEPYTAEMWLGIYAEHLEIHARQIRRNLEAWKKGR
ncbi:MAG: DinB family protein [Gemmatimonadales bacterium]